RRKPANPRPLRRPAQERRCASLHPWHAPRRTTARRYRNGKMQWSRRAHPWVTRPDKTTRGPGILFESLVATCSLLVRAVYTCESPRGFTGDCPRSEETLRIDIDSE